MSPTRPLVSFVVPAWNEAAELGGTLDAITAAARATGLAESSETIVVDDDSTDATAAIALAAGARVVPVSLRQIAAVRNAGAAEARGRILVFVDADTRIAAEPLRQALDAIEAGVAGGGARVRFDRPVPWWARAILAAVMLVSRIGRLATGCFVFCTREAFDIAGGFDERYYATEELVFSRALRRAGPVRIVPGFVETSARKVALFGLGRILLLTARVALLGPAAVRSRRGLDIWYGQGTREPAEPAEPAA
ncbi:MAG: glycosyltransferase [Planctomycetota bacterium]|jgi:glycosyltransferase involved in cell wall biosynthesis